MTVIRRWVREEPARAVNTVLALFVLLEFVVPWDGWPLVVAVLVAAGGQAVRGLVWSAPSHDLALEQHARLNPAPANLLPEDD